MPLHHIKSGLLALQTLQHLMVLIDYLLVISQPLLIIQRLLRVFPPLLVRKEVTLGRHGSETIQISLLWRNDFERVRREGRREEMGGG